jgi:DNA repair exonuclease SbcCD ATPase subunit
MIVFKKIRFKNFGSFGNTFTEIHLDSRKNTLVSGTNGNGKSFAFLDSITFALFGKPFRKINIPQLVNSINKKDCLVELDFEIGTDKYQVKRGLSPKIFEIHKNGELLNQDAKNKDYQEHFEEQILRMNYKSFTQVVILGSSSFVPFMQLPAADRRTVIEDILDINVFTTMNSILKGKIAEAKNILGAYDSDISLETEKLKLKKKFVESLKNKETESQQKLADKIKSFEDDCSKVETKRKELEKKLGSISFDLTAKIKTEKAIKTFEKLKTQIQQNHDNCHKEIGFYSENDNCPTCKQAITEDFKKEQVGSKTSKLQEYDKAIAEIETKLKEAEEQISKYEKIQNEIADIKLAIVQSNMSHTNLTNNINNLRNELKQFLSAKASGDDIDIETKELESIQSRIDLIKEERGKIQENLRCMEIASILLRDSGIKGKIIKNYLPIINKTVNKFLTAMDFFAQFHLDEEFNETIKSRNRDSFSYMSFSEGEKMRIDLSLLLAWREVARVKNSANCNLLILDEVFDSSLDAVGAEEFMKLLTGLDSKTNIFVISHRADSLVDKFPTVITLEKKKNFSKLNVA